MYRAYIFGMPANSFYHKNFGLKFSFMRTSVYIYLFKYTFPILTGTARSMKLHRLQMKFETIKKEVVWTLMSFSYYLTLYSCTSKSYLCSCLPHPNVLNIQFIQPLVMYIIKHHILLHVHLCQHAVTDIQLMYF